MRSLALAVGVRSGATLTITVAVVVQPFASVTVTVYVVVAAGFATGLAFVALSSVPALSQR